MCKGVKTIDKLITSMLFVSKNTKHMSSYFVGELYYSPYNILNSATKEYISSLANLNMSFDVK